MRVGLNGNFSASRYVSIVNNLFNVTKSGNYTLGIYMGKDKEKKYSINLDASATYTNSKSSVQADIKNYLLVFRCSSQLRHLPARKIATAFRLRF